MVGVGGKNIIYNALMATLNPGDEVLTTNHEYGAIERTWKFMEQKKGFTYKPLDILLPLNKQNFIDKFKKNITKNTKIIFLTFKFQYC